MMSAMLSLDLDPNASLTTADGVVGWLTTDGLRILVTIIGAVVLRWLLHRSIDRVVRGTVQRADERDRRTPGRAARVLSEATGSATSGTGSGTRPWARSSTASSTFAIPASPCSRCMGHLGIPLGPLLASAGVAGVALGFGAQSLVKDFLSGIFMILEDQYGVGDIIDTGEAIGTVEEVTLRVTRLRDGNGVAWYVRNGEIVRIGNKSQGWSTAIVDTAVAYDEDIERAIAVMREVVHQMDQDPAWQGRLLEEPTVVGVESIAAGAVTVRIIAKCAPNENFPVQREIRERLKVALDRSGIRAPQLAPYGGGAPAREATFRGVQGVVAA